MAKIQHFSENRGNNVKKGLDMSFKAAGSDKLIIK
jgi:hypothetical protein